MNYENPSLLEQAFRDIDVLFFQQPLTEQMISSGDSFKGCEIRRCAIRVLRVSTVGASEISRYLFQRIHGEGWNSFRNRSGMQFAILRPNILMQKFTLPYREFLLQGALYLPQGEGRTSYLDARDVAEAAEKILSQPLAVSQASFRAHGERALSNAEAVSLISNQAQRRVSYVPVTEDVALQSWKNQERILGLLKP